MTLRQINLYYGLAALFLVLLSLTSLSAQSNKQWRSECFNTFDEMVAGANRHGDSVQFVSIPSTRNVGGWLGSPYCILWRQ